jgi:hypothetical protein
MAFAVFTVGGLAAEAAGFFMAFAVFTAVGFEAEAADFFMACMAAIADPSCTQGGYAHENRTPELRHFRQG